MPTDDDRTQMTTPTPAPAPTPVDVTKRTPKPPAPPHPTRRWQVWEPDPRWAHPLEAALWTYVAALIGNITWFGIPAPSMGLLGVVAAAIGAGKARRRWPADEYGPDVAASMSMLAVVAGVAAGVWLVWACWTSPLSAVGWLVLATAWFGAWYALLRVGAPKAAAVIVAAEEDAQIAAATSTWTDILSAAGLGLRVVETRPTRAGYVIGVEPVDDTKPVSFDTLRGKLGDLTVKAAAVLARTGVTVRGGDIRIEETDAAHVHLIHVCTKHVLSLSIPFEPIEEPSTIADPVDFALYEDGRPVEVCFGGEQGGVNGKWVGATGGGKTVLANSLIGRVGENVDALNVVVASNKLVPLVYPWLKAWLDGRADRPGIDWVGGQHPQRVLEVLAAIHRIVVERNNALSNEATHVPTAAAPAIVVFVEEAGDMAARTPAPKIVTFDGQAMTFSRLIHEITRQCRSAQVSVILMNQTDLYGSSGEFGPEIARNTPFRVCLKTLAPQDGMSVLPGLSAGYTDTSKLRHNSMLVQPSIEDPRVMPAKSYKLTGDDVHDIAIRNAAWRPDLEPALAALLGDVWTDRWDAARLPELVAAARRDGLEWPVGTPEDPIDAELRALLDTHTEPEPDTEPAVAPSGEMPDAQAGADRLTEIADRIATPLTLPEPLASVVALLAEPGAPKDWVSTAQLAILLGRVDADAPTEQRRAAAQKLGRELSAIDPAIRSEQRDRLQQYDVVALRKVAARIARGDK